MDLANLSRPQKSRYAASGSLTIDGETFAAHRRLPRLDGLTRVEQRHAALLYGGILLLTAVVLRMTGMAGENFWHDEVTMLNIGLGGWNQIVDQFLLTGRPPVFGLLASMWTTLFGTGEVISRIPSYMAGVLSIAVLFQLGSLIVNQRVGLLAALVMTLSEFHIYYGQTYRYYAFYVLFVLLSFLFFYLLLVCPRRLHDVLYILFTALTFYTHPHGLFAIASQGIFFVIMLAINPLWRNRRTAVRCIALQLVVLVIIFPGLWESILAGLLAQSAPADTSGMTAGDSDVGLSWLQEPTVGSILRALSRFVFFKWQYFNPHGVLTAFVFVLLGTAYYRRRIGASQWSETARQLPVKIAKMAQRRLQAWVFLVCWLGGMLMFPWVLSFIVVPLFYDRYVLGASPAFYLILATIVFGVRRIVPVRVTVLAFIALLAPGLLMYYTLPDNEQWRDLASYVHAQAQPGDAIIVLTTKVHLAQPLEAFNWYYPDSATCDVYEDNLGDLATVDELRDCIADSRRIWLVALRWEGDFDGLSGNGLSGSLVEFFNAYDNGYWQLTQVMEGTPFYLLGLYLYELKSENIGAVSSTTVKE